MFVCFAFEKSCEFSHVLGVGLGATLAQPLKQEHPLHVVSSGSKLI